MVAAGTGSRFGGYKQLAQLGAEPMVDVAVRAARSVASGVVLVLPAELASAEASGSDGSPSHGADRVVAGGADRAASVREGLRVVPGEAEVIVVHDGARPLASPDLFRAVVEAVVGGWPSVGGAVPGLPVDDTLKEVAGERVVTTVDRDGLVAVQTPQAFRADVLRRAHEKEEAGTDDASLVEALGETVVVVPGERANLKITRAGDLEVARSLAGDAVGSRP